MTRPRTTLTNDAGARRSATTPLSAFRRAHGPTWLVAAAIYVGWAALTLLHDRIPTPALVLLGGIVIAWHGSLQHETIHGHPGGPRVVRELLGAPPLSLWLPYGIYRETHRRHHATAHLTDPAHDPESSFRSREQWAAAGPLERALALTLRTALGRMALGPLVTVARFFAHEALAAARGAPGRRRTWAAHGLSVLVVLAWLHLVAEMPLWKYIVAFVYPGASLTLLRSLAEHRSDPARERRTTVIEAGLFFRLLFLNNNLHAIHHRRPDLPWFELPSAWERARAQFTSRQPDLVQRGYLALVGRHALRPVSPPELVSAAAALPEPERLLASAALPEPELHASAPLPEPGLRAPAGLR
ncbi:MAG: fatty acid desaturase [Labilithrix sp.]|nr:fatty acid desaturase [Labilithrix sp.]MBX3217591.1 fatty acid desaturase [Labilithrix sp.]